MADEETKALLKSLLASNQEVKEEIRQSRETLSGEIRTLKEELRGEIRHLKEENEALRKEVDILTERLRKEEREGKKYKLMLYGLEEEDAEKDVTACLEIFNKTLGVSCLFNDFRNFYRVGKSYAGAIRPISIESSSYFLRKQILDSAKKLKGTNIFINPEYTQEDYKNRKVLNTYLKKARQNGQEAKIKGTTLIIEGKAHTLDQLENRTANHQREKEKYKQNQDSGQDHFTSKRRASLSPSKIEDIENSAKRITRNATRDQNRKL